MIVPEKTMSQIEDGSPAQIRAELQTLATVIFGSNVEALDWCATFCRINAGIEEICSSQGFECPIPGADAHAHTRTHAHTRRC